MDPREIPELTGEKLTGFDKFYIAALFFYCFLLFSPTVYALFPVTGLLVNGIRFLIAGVLTVFTLQQAIQRGSVRINRGLLLISFIFILLAILPSAYHRTTYLLFSEFTSFYLVYMFFLFYKRKYLTPVVDIATVFLFVMLILSIIGFIYALLGYQPLISGATSKGRMYYLYLTTGAVDNGIFGNVIRPQGIYEEPGSFSYIICTLCFLRMLTKRNDAVTFALLLFGNITFSMTHIMLFVVFIVHLIVKYKMKKVFAVYACAVAAMVVVAYMPMREPVNDLLFARFAYNKSAGRIEGNNRGSFFRNSVNVIKKDNAVLLWGMPRDADGVSVMETVWLYDGNPLTPVMEFGIFIAWLYYFYLLFFILCGIVDRRNFLVYFSIFFMLLQKPEFYRGGPTADLLLLFFTGGEMLRNRIAMIKRRALLGKNAVPECAGG